jgi:hypothetical protein
MVDGWRRVIYKYAGLKKILAELTQASRCPLSGTAELNQAEFRVPGERNWRQLRAHVWRARFATADRAEFR